MSGHPADPALAAVRPEPLRVVRTLAGLLLAVALGSLIMGTCSFGFQQMDGLGAPGVAPLGAIALWVFAAGSVYAANRQWLGRTRDQRLNRFALCLAIALPLLPVILIVGVNVFLALGGHL